MYVWSGLVFDKLTENVIRNVCININRDFKVNEQAFTLPQHISLKTSFNVENYEEVIEYMKSLLQEYEDINIKLVKITKLDGVLWIDVEENEQLREIHNLLNKTLLDKYSVPLIKFDGNNFTFHSTLFQDNENKEKLNEMYYRLENNLKFPINLKLNEVNFGISDIGKVGTYKVYDKIIMNGGRKNDNR